jgi:hypothetical protein
VVPLTKTSARPVLLALPSTQTKIKNYFYGNIRYLLKLILKYFVRTSTGFINDIKTDTLLNIYESKEGTYPLMQSMKALRW